MSSSPSIWKQPANLFILFYYIIHVPITLFFDSQVVLPGHYYPSPVTQAMKNYQTIFQDNLVANKPAWFWGMTVVEVFVQMPFFFISIYAFVMKRNWIRIPTIIYGSHVATTLIPIIATIFFDNELKPQSPTALMGLFSIYVFWFIVPVWMVLYAWRYEDLFGINTTTTTTKASVGNKKKQ